MEGRWNNCNMMGGYLSQIIANCFRPNVEVCVFRDGEYENIYRGDAGSMPRLNGYKVIDIQYDLDQYTLYIEVK